MITTKIYLRRHPLDSEMVELMRQTANKYTDSAGNKRVRTTDSIFAVMHIDLFEDDVLCALTDDESEDDFVEVEFTLIEPVRRAKPDPADYGDWLYDQRKDDALTGDS